MFNNEFNNLTTHVISYIVVHNGVMFLQHTGGSQIVGSYTSCTLPRQQQQQVAQWQYGPVAHLPPGVYPVPYHTPHPQLRPRAPPREPPIPMQPLATTDEEPTPDTPLMVNKRESSV